MEYTIGDTMLELSYLVAALLFVVGLKMLSHPESARRGNLWAFAGMALAMITTLLLHRDGEGNGISIANIWIIMAAIGIGAAIGWIIARKVKMTAMPQLVSLYNATGGAASALVALLEYPNAVAGDAGSISGDCAWAYNWCSCIQRQHGCLRKARWQSRRHYEAFHDIPEPGADGSYP
jgi:H+-translocating NAD(P) transhydrogenase subunit beta